MALIAALPILPKLEELQWQLFRGFGEAGLRALAQHCPSLRSLDCASDEVTDVDLIALVRGCPALRTLKLLSCDEWLTDPFLYALAQHCRYLEELRLPGWGWTPTRSAVVEVIAACTLLRTMQDGFQASTLVVSAGRLRRLTISTY